MSFIASDFGVYCLFLSFEKAMRSGPTHLSRHYYNLLTLFAVKHVCVMLTKIPLNYSLAQS